MENIQTYPKALDTAYRLLAARPHTKAEIRRKLSRKGHDSETITAIVSELQEKGYLNEDDMAQRWAQALVREKLWGPLKISAYLMQKGISRKIIDQVQRQLWQEIDEPDIAAQALRKRFSGGEDESLRAKKAAFLRSRGFSSDVIYKISKEPCEDQW